MLETRREGVTRLRALRTELAGVQGFEPQLPDPESGVLPLDDTPVGQRKVYHCRAPGTILRPWHAFQAPEAEDDPALARGYEGCVNVVERAG